MAELLTPGLLYGDRSRINLYRVHCLYQKIADQVSQRMRAEFGFDIPIVSGMWGGSYLIAQKDGTARTNVVRLYCLNSMPQSGPLDDEKNLEKFMEVYQAAVQQAFAPHGVRLEDPHWGEKIPYTNQIRPNIALQMWDANRRAKFVRAFFVWNSAPWEESIIYDTVRNVKQIKEYLNVDHRPLHKTADDYKFVLQDVLIIYFALKPALTPDFIEHAEPTIQELLNHFVPGLHDPNLIHELYLKIYNECIVYGLEEALDGPYKSDGLDIRRIEEWPVEKINWVPEELKLKLVPMIQDIFKSFQTHLTK